MRRPSPEAMAGVWAGPKPMAGRRQDCAAAVALGSTYEPQGSPWGSFRPQAPGPGLGALGWGPHMAIGAF